MATVVATLAMLVVVAAACGEGGEGGALPERTPSSPAATAPAPPEPELTGPEQAAVQEVLDVLDRYLEVFAELAIEGVDFVDLSWMAQLAQYGLAGGSVADASVLEAHTLKGHRAAGTLDWEFVTVREVDLERAQPWVQLQICIDQTEWRTVELASDEPVSGPGGRYVATIGSVYRDDEFSDLRPEPAWRITDWEDDRSSTC